MTTVHVSMARDDGTGTLAALPGSLYWEPTTRREDGTVVALPVGFAMNLVAGEATKDVEPSGLTWCWRVTERVQDGTVRYVSVSDSATTLEYVDLPDVDPDTLVAWTPADPEAAYTAALAAKVDEPDAEGTAGQALTTDGAGGRTWTTIAGGVTSVDGETGAVSLSDTYAPTGPGFSYMGRPLQVVTDSTDLNGTNAPQSNGTDTGMNTITRHRIHRPAASVVIAWGNLRDFAGTANGNNITVRASVELNGTLTAVYFNGRRDVVIEPDALVLCDPVGVNLAAGSDLVVRTRVTVASGEKWPNNRLTNNVTGEATEYGTATTDKTLTGTVTVQRTYAYGPTTVLAAPVAGYPGTLVGVGDSIVQQAADTTGGDASGVVTYDWGFLRRFARSASLPFVNLGVIGDTAQGWRTMGGRKYGFRKARAAEARVAVVNFGRNDLDGGRSLAQIQADLTEVWTQLDRVGVRVFQTTITPKATSTDAFATTTNQTPAATEAIRVAINDWIRTTPAPLAGYVETADTVESARNSGLWKPTYTADGLHPLTVGHAAMATALSASALGLA